MLTPGQEFTLNATVHNQGDEQAAATMLHYYRSNNATITSSDTEVGTDAVGALDASATSAASITLTTPTSVSAEVGIYYGACVASVSGESNTDNNCSSAVKITVNGQESPEDETQEEEADDGQEEEEETEEEGSDGPVSIPDANLRAAIEAALGKARGAPITVAEMETLTTLRAYSEGIRDLTGLEFATNLTSLDLWGNNITSISSLAGLTNLTSLSLWDNNLRDISSLAGLTNLTSLTLGGNNLRDISSLRGLTNLTLLDLLGNNLRDISSLADLTNLTSLDLWGNNLTNISSLADLTNLTSLRLGANNLRDISSLADLTNLTSLDLGGNNLRDISSLAGLTNLTYLYLARNTISDVSSLRGLTNLTYLYLARNTISDVSSLRGLTNLTYLYLARNTISDVSSLRGLTNLTYLDLLFNNITDVSSLRGLTNLIYLDLRGNSLGSSSINDHIPALVSSGVTVRFDRFREGDFDIELVFLDPFTESEKREIRHAARRWMSIITEDLPDYVFTQGWSGECGDRSFRIPSGERIDDLRIYVVSDELVFSGSGWGSPTLLRETTHLPALGCMAFDGANLLLALHEIGHVLGIYGPIWTDLGFLQDPNGDIHFNGPLAIAAFDDAGGRDYTGKKVPVEKMDGSHWRWPVLEGEIMGPGGGGALSSITVQSLADLGYGVDVTLADAYTLPDAVAAKASAKISAALPSISGVDVTLADAYTLPGVSAALPSIPGDDRLRGRLENAEWIEGRGFDFDLRDNRLMGRLAPYPQAEPKPLCGSHIGREPIYVIDPQGRIIRTLGD